MITFRGEHTGKIMMFEGPALELLRMMGTSGNRKGALMAEDVPAALQALEAALARRAAEARAEAPPAAEAGEDDETEAAEEVVDLARRAAPLLELLREAVATRSYLTWGE